MLRGIFCVGVGMRVKELAAARQDTWALIRGWYAMIRIEMLRDTRAPLQMLLSGGDSTHRVGGCKALTRLLLLLLLQMEPLW